ncbi:MAG: hypothetical protein ACOX1O_03235 [Eggerthellaceae bacterium]|jgi:hypothetical protein
MRFTQEIHGHGIACEAVTMGPDVAISLSGGEAPHIGCTVLAIPRPSLTGSGRSATVSTLNRTGHKDDALASLVARKVASRRNCAVACCCGIHTDNASPEFIQAVIDAADALADRICDELEGFPTNPDSGQSKRAMVR